MHLTSTPSQTTQPQSLDSTSDTPDVELLETTTPVGLEGQTIYTPIMNDDSTTSPANVNVEADTVMSSVKTTDQTTNTVSTEIPETIISESLEANTTKTSEAATTESLDTNFENVQEVVVEMTTDLPVDKTTDTIAPTTDLAQEPTISVNADIATANVGTVDEVSVELPKESEAETPLTADVTELVILEENLLGETIELSATTTTEMPATTNVEAPAPNPMVFDLTTVQSQELNIAEEQEPTDVVTSQQNVVNTLEQTTLENTSTLTEELLESVTTEVSANLGTDDFGKTNAETTQTTTDGLLLNENILTKEPSLEEMLIDLVHLNTLEANPVDKSEVTTFDQMAESVQVTTTETTSVNDIVEVSEITVNTLVLQTGMAPNDVLGDTTDNTSDLTTVEPIYFTMSANNNDVLEEGTVTQVTSGPSIEGINTESSTTAMPQQTIASQLAGTTGSQDDQEFNDVSASFTNAVNLPDQAIVVSEQTTQETSPVITSVTPPDEISEVISTAVTLEGVADSTSEVVAFESPPETTVKIPQTNEFGTFSNDGTLEIAADATLQVAAVETPQEATIEVPQTESSVVERTEETVSDFPEITTDVIPMLEPAMLVDTSSETVPVVVSDIDQIIESTVHQSNEQITGAPEISQAASIDVSVPISNAVVAQNNDPIVANSIDENEMIAEEVNAMSNLMNDWIQNFYKFAAYLEQTDETFQNAESAVEKKINDAETNKPNKQTNVQPIVRSDWGEKNKAVKAGTPRGGKRNRFGW